MQEPRFPYQLPFFVGDVDLAIQGRSGIPVAYSATIGGTLLHMLIEYHQVGLNIDQCAPGVPSVHLCPFDGTITIKQGLDFHPLADEQGRPDFRTAAYGGAFQSYEVTIVPGHSLDSNPHESCPILKLWCETLGGRYHELLAVPPMSEEENANYIAGMEKMRDAWVARKAYRDAVYDIQVLAQTDMGAAAAAWAELHNIEP